MITDILLNIIVTFVVFGFPFFLLFGFLAPLLYTKFIAKKKLTVLNVVISTLIGALIVAAMLFTAYWGVAYLQGLAARELYGY